MSRIQILLLVSGMLLAGLLAERVAGTMRGPLTLSGHVSDMTSRFFSSRHYSALTSSGFAGTRTDQTLTVAASGFSRTVDRPSEESPVSVAPSRAFHEELVPFELTALESTLGVEIGEVTPPTLLCTRTSHEEDSLTPFDSSSDPHEAIVAGVTLSRS